MSHSIPRALLVFLACACGSPTSTPPPDPIARRPAAAPSVPITTEPRVETSTVGPVAEAAAPAGPFAYGDVFFVEDDAGDVLFRAFVVERPPAPRPTSAPIGHAPQHVGAWELRPIADEASPYPTVTTIGEDSTCEARVVRARHLHASMPDPDDESRTLEKSFLALDLEGCERAAFAIAGAPVTMHRIDPRALPLARPALAALIAARDAEFAVDSYMIGDAPRVLELPARELAIVLGHRRWIVHRGRVMSDRFGGDPAAVIEAGARTLFVMTSPSEGWLASLDELAPAPRCTVDDRSPTPLNVREEPRARSRAVGTIANGTIVDIAEARGDWRRVVGSPAGWVFHDGLRCP